MQIRRKLTVSADSVCSAEMGCGRAEWSALCFRRWKGSGKCQVKKR